MELVGTLLRVLDGELVSSPVGEFVGLELRAAEGLLVITDAVEGELE